MVDADGAVFAPAWSTCGRTSASPGSEHRETIATAAAPPRPAGSPRSARCRTPTRDGRPSPGASAPHRGVATGCMSMLPYGAATTRLPGRGARRTRPAEEAGAVAFTDGRRAIATPAMRLALSYARGFGGPRAAPGGSLLAAGGAATEGEQATRLGLPGIPAAAEAMMVARDIALAGFTGGAVHFAHVATGEALELIRARRMKGLAVTCDTAPPYFDLNETTIGTCGPMPSCRLLCGRKPTGWPWSPGWPTARSTPSHPTISRVTPTTSGCPSLWPRPAARPCHPARDTVLVPGWSCLSWARPPGSAWS